MHTSQLTDGVVAHHDGSYDGGPVILVIPAAQAELQTTQRADDAEVVMVTVPFEALKQLVSDYVRGEAISFYEQATPDEILRGPLMRRGL
jgi:hypothetical protein